MNTSGNKNESKLPTDALYHLAVAEPDERASVLDALVRQYPEHVAELRAAAVELALDAAADEAQEPEDMPDVSETLSPAVEKAMRKFRARRAEIEAAQKAEREKVVDPFAPLDRAALRGLGQRLNASTLFVMKLRDRRIRPETMSDGFRRKLSDELHVPMDVVVAHFAAPPRLAQGAYYKADERPEVGAQQSFEEAVKSSQLTDEQIAYLRGL
jgi:hypothetical protein